MNRLIQLIVLFCFCSIIYLTASLFLKLPMPTFYKNLEYNHWIETKNNDPIFKLGNSFIYVVKQRDSLQHIVDSLTIKTK